MAAAASASNEVEYPLVFQCSRCRTIVGDSLSFQFADAASGTVVLSGVSRISVATEPAVVESAGPFAGASSLQLSCAQCEQTLGVRIVSAPPQRIGFVHQFTLRVDALHSYRLGTVERGTATPLLPLPSRPPPAATSATAPAAPVAAPPPPPTVAAAAAADSAAAGSVTDSISKLQHMILLMNERVTELEARVERCESSAPPAANGEKRKKSASQTATATSLDGKS